MAKQGRPERLQHGTCRRPAKDRFRRRDLPSTQHALPQSDAVVQRLPSSPIVPGTTSQRSPSPHHASGSTPPSASPPCHSRGRDHPPEGPPGGSAGADEPAQTFPMPSAFPGRWTVSTSCQGSWGTGRGSEVMRPMVGVPSAGVVLRSTLRSERCAEESEQFGEVVDHEGGAGVQQPLPARSPVHADHRVEAPRASGLDTGDGVLDHDALFAGHAQQPRSVFIACRLGLPGNPSATATTPSTTTGK
ncbi:hypothetical protein AHiyo1_01890 [Arthrobacter sp. Hiyo1]|nr:hypothetical protein AHiyo1_01890 [Arthrobacter sp. Hiyo1]